MILDPMENQAGLQTISAGVIYEGKLYKLVYKIDR